MTRPEMLAFEGCASSPLAETEDDYFGTLALVDDFRIIVCLGSASGRLYAVQCCRFHVWSRLRTFKTASLLFEWLDLVSDPFDEDCAFHYLASIAGDLPEHPANALPI